MYYGGLLVGIRLSELEAECRITLLVSTADNEMRLEGYIKKVLNDAVAIIGIDFESPQRLNFDNVKVQLECMLDENVPYLWKQARVVNYKNEYVLQVSCEGIRHNRRGSFRVPVSNIGTLKMVGRGSQKVMIKDVSATGFGIADRTRELGFNIGDRANLIYEENGYELNLTGILVRKEEREDMDIYGFEITNLCRDLPKYISFKQRHRS
ncbi:MAG: PilZ domain-containing protein [Lachnospiraceae bacterium]|nr:PilZ domain-containing protein [Lachnospiraceae bacterium]